MQIAPKQAIEAQEFPGIDQQRHTILAALIPHNDVAWVFRLVGSRDEIQDQRKTFDNFIAAMTFEGEDARPGWELPTGWEEEATSPGALREATIRVSGAGDRKLDLSVSRLPLREDWLYYRLRNFNRWRRQLQLPVAGADELSNSSTEIELAAAPTKTASVVAIHGLLSETELARMTSVATDSDLPGNPAASDGQIPVGLGFSIPEGWTQTVPRSSFSRVTFAIGQQAQRGTVDVSAFSTRSGPQIADPLANVNRWRVLIGLGAITSEELADISEPIEIDGAKGIIVALEGETGPHADRAVRASMVVHGQEVWFFKLDGPKSIVEGEADRFEEFLRSVEFTE